MSRVIYNLLTLSEEPLLATDENVKCGLEYVDKINSGGGTQMMPAVKKSLESPLPNGRLRIVSFMSDGKITNDNQILGEVQKADMEQIRFFPFSIGSAPNRYLLDRLADLSGGKSFYVGNNDDPKEAVDSFYSRIDAPVYINLNMDWGGLEVYDLYPEKLPDLFISEPVFISGRYKNSGSFNVKLSGLMSAIEGTLFDQSAEFDPEDAFETEQKEISINVDFPKSATAESGISSIWARSKVKELMDKIRKRFDNDIKMEVIETGIKYHLMTDYTSFVAVEENVVNESGENKEVVVPVELPEGTTYEGYTGSVNKAGSLREAVGQSYSGAPNLSMDFAGDIGLSAGYGETSADPRTMFLLIIRYVLSILVLGSIVSLLVGIIKYSKNRPKAGDKDPKKKEKALKRAKIIISVSVLIIVTSIGVGFIISYFLI